MPTHMELVLQAAAFAAEKHRTQRRKDIDTPFINHPIQLAYILVQADIEDPVVLAAALLHDTIEDTQTTHDEIEIVFGHEIANIVSECSDDKTLDKLVRKQAQVDRDVVTALSQLPSATWSVCCEPTIQRYHWSWCGRRSSLVIPCANRAAISMFSFIRRRR